MTESQQAAYVVAMSACVIAEVAAMKAANFAASQERTPPPYNEQSFKDLITRYGIHHNAVIEYFTGRYGT